ncbi:MAG: flagellin [Porticoccaceae bacterium]|jgi:flagellin
MSVINTNVAATVTSNALAKNERAMGQAMERLSTGQRINSAADDAAGLAISSKMTSQIRGLDQAVRNANDAISMIQTADGAAIEITNMFQRMRELAVQSKNGTNTANDVTSLGVEFDALLAQINSIATNTQWNGKNILDGTSTPVTFQVGANANQTVQVAFGNFKSDNTTTYGIFTGNNAAGAAVTKLSESSVDDVNIIGNLDAAIGGLNTQRATFGAAMNRLGYAVDNLTNVSQNASASRSRILDADYAAESTELARTQIIQQAGTAMLAQANQQAQSVLTLLKG